MKGKYLELVSAVFLILWGVWVLNPFVDSFSSSNVFIIMRQMLPEWVWGAITLSLGIIKLVVRRGNNLQLSRIVAVVATFFYILLTCVYGLGNLWSTAVITYLSFTLLSAIITLELSRQIKNGADNEEHIT